MRAEAKGCSAKKQRASNPAAVITNCFLQEYPATNAKGKVIGLTHTGRCVCLQVTRNPTYSTGDVVSDMARFYLQSSVLCVTGTMDNSTAVVSLSSLRSNIT